MKIVVANCKGGVGKTTTAFHLAHALALYGYRVLAVDLDPQGSLSFLFSSEETEEGMGKVLVGNRRAEEVVRRVSENIDLLPADTSLSRVEVHLISVFDRERVLKRRTESLFDRYDFVVVDTPPSLSLLTLNAVVCADCLIVPVDTRHMGVRSLRVFFEGLEEFRSRVKDAEVEVVGILPTFLERTLVSKRALKEIEERFRDYRILPAVRKSVKVSRVALLHQPVFLTDPGSEVAEAYLYLGEEVERWAVAVCR